MKKLSYGMLPALFTLVLSCALALGGAFTADGAEVAEYVGAEACEQCHAGQYESYMKNSSKAHSWRSIAKMQSKLTEAEKRECYACHTTGYGEPGGFVSIETTPEKANVSCESCHGPGSLHAETGDTDEIRRTPDIEGCIRCHNGERIQNFNFKPMLYHGGH